MNLLNPSTFKGILETFWHWLFEIKSHWWFIILTSLTTWFLGWLKGLTSSIRALRLAYLSDMGRHCDALVENVSIYWSCRALDPEQDRAREIIIDHHFYNIGLYVDKRISKRFSSFQEEAAKNILKNCQDYIYEEGWADSERKCSTNHARKCVEAIQDLRTHWDPIENTPIPLKFYLSMFCSSFKQWLHLKSR
ncbi:hypothetical protein [Oecophyllibacter saccharovorans]|uniref:DUF4760 domain-containing protein n=1 Tax=Oecophyllibacter saccharovorans TaxID=2558360 RepID=A0A506UKM0_9PROT|nr:hypothetical protein [Oecophyllibacter saccharovorans]TPW33868.1 hypothetical protein E3202_04550 [Oecophyllibacter saccharovorans]